MGRLDPAEMGLGPVYASTALLRKHHLKLMTLIIGKLMRRFAAQVLACLKAWESDDYAREYLGARKSTWKN